MSESAIETINNCFVLTTEFAECCKITEQQLNRFAYATIQQWYPTRYFTSTHHQRLDQLRG